MNLLVYLRFLRPLRSLLLIAICTIYTGSLWGQNVLHLDSRSAWFMALAIALPLLLGFFIAGAAHEPMHRPFALVLPNLRRRQRMAAAVSVLIAAFAATYGAIWIAPAVSPFATFGLACALIALPCIDRRQRLGGLAGGIVAILSWLLLGFVVGAKLGSALNAAPWLFLLGGLAISAGSLLQGFSRESLRVRAETLCIAYQTHAFSYLFHRGMVARWQAEVTANRNRRKCGPSASGRDWPVRSVGTTAHDWMRVLWHANFGARKRATFLQVESRFAVTMLVYVITLLGITYFLGQKDCWVILAQLPVPDMQLFTTKTAEGVAVNFMLLQTGVALFCAFLLLPQGLAYPISRERMARVMFLHTTIQWAAALVVPATTIFCASLIGKVISGTFSPWHGLTVLLAVDLQLAALIPLLVAAGTLRRPSLRILAAVPVGMAIMVVATSGHRWDHLVLTPPGVFGLLAATAASQWLLWHRLHRQYATSDLVLGTGLVNPLGLGSVSSH